MLVFKYINCLFFTSLVGLWTSSANSFVGYISRKLQNGVLCNPFLMSYDIRDCLDELTLKIYGQPFITENLIPSLEDHFKKLKLTFGLDLSNIPIVLRFHGPTGVGKTLAADILSNCGIFKKKLLLSPSVQIDLLGVEKFKEVWSKKIEEIVETCRRSIFVFDDLNETSIAILNDMPPFRWQQNSAYSQSMFIYISQDSAQDIVTTTSHFLKEGIPREDFVLEDFMHALKTENGGLWKSISALWETFSQREVKHLNVHELFIPFLPMDIKTVLKCLKREMSTLGKPLQLSIMKDVLSSLECPLNEEVLYSDLTGEFCPTGCKLVTSKVPLSLRKHDEL